MSTSDDLLGLAIGLIAMLFACVGQAGGAGYVAVMGLFGLGPAAIKPAALALTLLVAVIGVVRFHSLGLLKSRDWYPFALLGVPCSLAGGTLDLPGHAYRLTVAVLLLAAAAQMIRTARAGQMHDERALPQPPLLPAILAGGAIGLAAGLTGIGGGVLLAPLMLSLGWATTKRAAAAAQVNNLYTAASALTGVLASSHALPAPLPWWAGAAALGGMLGSWLGAKHLPASVLRTILAAVLFISGVKLALG
ncbi:MAG TPA: sulfite exporter TauE/SafE family protein [Rhizomicrobium sp.]|nr:sulfite exporter TauE/SafE family protein [Rhizomicrobium sp.]